MKKLLIVNTLPEDDPAVSPALEVLGRGAEEVRVIHAFEKNLRPCIGCNACWLVTPGICAVKDGYEELLKAYLAYDATVFLSGTALNFVDYRMKNIIDRMMFTLCFFGYLVFVTVLGPETIKQTHSSAKHAYPSNRFPCTISARIGMIHTEAYENEQEII